MPPTNRASTTRRSKNRSSSVGRLAPLILFIGGWLILSFAACSDPAEVPPTNLEKPLGPDYLVVPKAPEIDHLALAARLRGHAQPFHPIKPNMTNLQTGQIETFHVMDLVTFNPKTISAELVHVSPNAYFFVEEGLTISQEDLANSAHQLEERIIPGLQKLINPTWTPGAGIDSRISLLHARIRGASGYVNHVDLLPANVYPTSNQRPMVYISLLEVQPATEPYYAVLAHELQHAAHHQADPFEVTWVQEGTSELFTELIGYPANFHLRFLANTDIQLTDWSPQPSISARHYGAAHLFFKYLTRRYGAEQLPTLVANRETNIDGIESFLEEVGAAGGFKTAFTDWTIANYLGAGAGSIPTIAPLAPGQTYGGNVAQFGADYFRLAPMESGTKIHFEGAPTTQILSGNNSSGNRFWWSNRGDHINTTLTRRFNLTEVTQATLRYKVWFDIERHFDHAYVSASADDGVTWQILRGRHSETDNRLLQSFGPSYTGKSGGGPTATWAEESINLTPYAGGPVILRFDYATDEGVNGDGFALDDISIKEIGFFDDGTIDLTWEARGFVRTTNAIKQAFFVSLLLPAAESSVKQMELDEVNKGELLLPQNQETIVVVAALAPVTTKRTNYKVTIIEESSGGR